MLRTWFVIFLAGLVSCNAPPRPSHSPRPLDPLHVKRLHEFQERDLDRYLHWLSSQTMTLPQRIEHLGRKTIGQPYRLSLLGEHPFELIDPDPTFCLQASDCVTFVEQTFAMAMSTSWAEFYITLQRIRYHDGVVSYRTRNHFTEGDWNPNNVWLFEEITASLHGEAAVPMITRIDRAAFLRRAGLASDEPPKTIDGHYIPHDRLTQVADALQVGDVIQFVRSAHGNQFVGHMGLILRDGSGWPMLLHSGKPSVAELPLVKYLDAHPDFVGFKILRPRPNLPDPLNPAPPK